MTTGTLDKRLVILLGVSLAAIAVLRFGVFRESAPAVVGTLDSAPAAERRLQRVRDLAATVAGKEELLKQATAELAVREKGIIQADTAAQAQAQLLDIVHRLAAANGFDARGAEQLSEARPLGNDYGEVSVTVPLTCGIDQLVNFVAALANEPQILATNEIRVSGGSDKKKNLQVRLSLSGAVPRKLVPVRKGPRS